MDCSTEIAYLTLVLVLILSFTHSLEITIRTLVFLFRLIEIQFRVENFFQKCFQPVAELFFQGGKILYRSGFVVRFLELDNR